MDQLKEKLIDIENNFNKFKKKIERFHLFFVFLYFLPPLAALFIYNRFLHEEPDLYLKIIILSIIIFGVFIHFFIRFRYQRSKSGYKKYIVNKMNILKKEFSNENEFNSEVVESARQIFEDNRIEFSNITINQSLFWHFVFVYLGIEIEET